ncbi:unnamed protein product [Nezara viridula]|uniref:Uncharacterized protein n=1 Tax=Nezara viridula TaxID=85310 RepID=A0A9P0MMF2_NEZVI|nr:unnamed protein product [Nezara viridula]
MYKIMCLAERELNFGLNKPTWTTKSKVILIFMQSVCIGSFIKNSCCFYLPLIVRFLKKPSPKIAFVFSSPQ